MPITERGEEWYSVAEVATLSGRSEGTIRRRLRDDVFPRAEQLDGAWRIPSADLRAAGFVVDGSDGAEAADLEQRVRDLEAAVAERDATIAELRAELDTRPAAPRPLDVLRSVPRRVASAVRSLPPLRDRRATGA
jgi:hypothetical protein